LAIETTNWEATWCCDLRYYPDICLEDVGKIAIRIICSVPRCERGTSRTSRSRSRPANYSAATYRASVC